MKVLEPLVAEGYEWVNADNVADYETFLAFDGKPRGAGWKPINVRRVRADKSQAFRASDFPWLGAHVLIMRRPAVDALRDLFDANGEILPLATDDGLELFALNVRVVDALDEAHSAVTRFPGTNRIMRIKRPVFVASLVKGIDIFRLPYRASSTYVSEYFVERVKRARLLGLEFNEVWSE